MTTKGDDDRQTLHSDLFGDDSDSDSDSSNDDLNAPTPTKVQESDSEDDVKLKTGLSAQDDVVGLFGDADSESDEELPNKQLGNKRKRSVEDEVVNRKKLMDDRAKQRREASTDGEPASQASTGGVSGDEYDSDEPVDETKEDRAFIDDNDDLADVLAEYKKDTQEFHDSRPGAERSDEEKEAPIAENPLDVTLKSMKGRGRQKQIELDPQHAADLARELRSAMDDAKSQDDDDLAQGKPALNKLKLLPKVVKLMSKVNFQIYLLDYGILITLKGWLQMSPDGSLPNLSLRSKILEAISKLPIGKGHLKESSIGKTIMKLWKHKKETIENKERCRSLIDRWSRVVFERTTDYKKLAELEDEAPRRRRPAPPRSAASTVNYQRARIPQPMSLDFVTRPAPRDIVTTVSNRPTMESSKGKLAKTMQSNTRPTRRNVRAMKISIEGRGT